MPLRSLAISAASLAVLATSALGAQSWQPVTKASEVPETVKSLLYECSEVTENADEWLNGENLALIDLGGNKKMWFSSCERSAGQIYFAVVVEEPKRFTRIYFDQFVDGKLDNGRDSIPGAGWHQKTKTLTGQASAGCAGNIGIRWTWQWTGETFRLIEQTDNDDCEREPGKWPVVYQAK